MAPGGFGGFGLGKRKGGAANVFTVFDTSDGDAAENVKKRKVVKIE